MTKGNVRARHVLAGAVAGLASISGAGNSAGASCPFPFFSPPIDQQFQSSDYSFRYDGVLGTSLDLIVQAESPEQAERCESAVLAEIQRLNQILSTYESTSEISRYAAGVSDIRSNELAELLGAYDVWTAQTAGAIDVNMGGVIRAWKSAANTSSPPDPATLVAARQVPRSLNVDALGKGYIIDRAVQVAREISPGGLLNIGGDIRVWGNRVWKIGVADPRNPGDNVPALGWIPLQNAAVATSGDYARYIDIAASRYSHIIDPRTLRPVRDMISATVAAPDCLTANALSTAASVLGVGLGRELIESHETSAHLLMDRTQRVHAGVRLAGSGAPSGAPGASALESNDASASSKDTWPAGFQVAIGVNLRSMDASQGGQRGGRGGRGGMKRPYIAVWVQDKSQKVVRTVAVWGGERRWLRELTYWSQAVANDPSAGASVTRATRPPGKYTITWDGKDDHGNPLPRGEYTITLEVNREHGRHVKESATIVCDGEPKTSNLKATPESDESTVEYAPQAK